MHTHRGMYTYAHINTVMFTVSHVHEFRIDQLGVDNFSDVASLKETQSPLLVAINCL